MPEGVVGTVDGVVRTVAGVARRGCCCDPSAPPPPPCPWWWRADICVVPWCPAPASIYVCSDTPRADGLGLVEPGCVIHDHYHCYLVKDDCKYVLGVPGSGECALPPGAVLQTFGSYHCGASCAGPVGGESCEPVAGWVALAPCDCSPAARCGEVRPPSTVSKRYAECVDYFELLNAGHPCPSVRAFDDMGNVVCLRADVAQGLVPVLPPGAQVHGFTHTTCCECCASTPPAPPAAVPECDHHPQRRVRVVDCAVEIDDVVECCCHACDVLVVVDYLQRNYAPASACPDGPPGITPGTTVCIETHAVGHWRRAPGSGAITGSVVRTTRQWFVGGACSVLPGGPGPCVDVIPPPPAGLCRIDAVVAQIAGYQPPGCVEPVQEGTFELDCARYAIDMRGLSEGVTPEGHVSRLDLGGATISSALGRCGRCGPLAARDPVPAPPPGGG